MELLSITQLRQAAQQGRLKAAVHAQVEGAQKKETRDGKPFWEVTVADAEGKLTLRAWSDGPAFAACAGLKTGGFLEIAGEFSHGQFGVESRDWACRELLDAERQALLEGPAELRARQAADWESLVATIESVGDPRLRALGRLVFADFSERFRRTAAARVNHHARRGGLVEHVAQMMRTAQAVAAAYPRLNRDLLLTGVLFHDIGKLWENSYPADGFTMPFNEHGELLGHIPIGIEVVNSFWKQLKAREEFATWETLEPKSEQVRLHLLHLVASHHGSLEFGSPVIPKTPEAWALHYIDNLDAKLEMIFTAYANAKTVDPNGRILERVWALGSSPVVPLPSFLPEEPAPEINEDPF